MGHIKLFFDEYGKLYGVMAYASEYTISRVFGIWDDNYLSCIADLTDGAAPLCRGDGQ